MKRFTNKTAVVTGGASGIGRAISLRLAREGASVIILELNEMLGEKAVDEIKSAGGLAESIACDVSSTTSVEQAFNQIPSLDILINNAGIAHIGSVEETQPEDLDRIYAVNVKGVYHCLYFGLPLMLARDGGIVLNMASIASKIGIKDRFAYSMSKGAVFAMTLSVARDYVDRNIRCNCLCPARIHTPFVDGFLEKSFADSREKIFQELSEFQPIGRMGEPGEVAALACFLCSDEATFITGSAYDIDGGVVSLR